MTNYPKRLNEGTRPPTPSAPYPKNSEPACRTARDFVTPWMYDRLPLDSQKKVDYWYEVYRNPRPTWWRFFKRAEWDRFQSIEIPLLLDLRKVGLMFEHVEQKEKKPSSSSLYKNAP